MVNFINIKNDTFNRTKKESLPLFLFLPVLLFEFLSTLISFFQFFLIKMKWMKISETILESPEGYQKTIQKIWFSRMMRRSLSLILRTPFRKSMVKLVDNTLNLPKSGCVIAIPHTPWAKLLAEWCCFNNFALVFAGGSWIKRTGHLNIPGGSILGIRKVIFYLKCNGYVVIIGDNINRSKCCPVSYLGNTCNASILPVRLATLANVPIVTFIPKVQNRHIKLQNGIIIDVNDIMEKPNESMQKIFSFYENEIYASPSIYTPFVLASLNQ